MARSGAFALAAALLVVAAKASYDEPAFSLCRKADDCVGSDDTVDDKTTICSQIDTVTVAATADKPQATYNWGYCVQCTSNTDCNSDEWCAPAMKVSAKWWNDDEWARMSEAQQQQRQTKLDSWSNGDMQMQGKCVQYGAFSDDEAAKIGSACGGAVGSNNNDPETATNEATCQFVYSWQPEWFKCVGDACPGSAQDDTLKNSNYHKPGSCTAKISRNTGGSTNANCDGGVGWSGVCKDNTCQICYDGDSRSGSTDRVCIGNTYTTKAWNDGTVRTIAGDVSSQLLLVLVVFAALMAVIACMGCIYTCKTGSAAAKA